MDIEDINYNSSDQRKVSNLLFRYKHSQEDKSLIKIFIKDLIKAIKKSNNFSKIDFNKTLKLLSKEHKIKPSIASLNYCYREMVSEGEIVINVLFENYNVGKICRTNSGITQITVLTSPYPNGKEFSCEHDCYYCPKQPGYPRSYIGKSYEGDPKKKIFLDTEDPNDGEPAVLRAEQNNWVAVNQMWDRMSTLLLCGLSIDKLEVMVLGGTWGSYPEDYREEFIRDLYYAANTFYSDTDKRRNRLSLKEEIQINETTYARIIGLTLETRPDHVTKKEILLLRKYNCTRIQIGVQHTDKKILSKINRGCYIDDVKRAIFNLLNVGLKVDVHLMFDLPFATPDDDRKMINTMLTDTDLRFDQAKLYPFASLEWTKTKEWEDKGMDLHYSQEELQEVLIETKIKIHPWIRLNRVIRDLPSTRIFAGNSKPNLRQDIHQIMKERGLRCHCIRCREVKNKQNILALISKAKLIVRKYEASNGTEYFISFELTDPDDQNYNYIFGFCRLRITKEMGYIKDIKPRIHRDKNEKEDNEEKYINVFPELNGVAMIRELHVYGNMNAVSTKLNNTSQHNGFGKKMVLKAENIARTNGYSKIAIISGVGARKYYENKLDYKLGEYDYMYKNLYDYTLLYLFYFVIFIIFIYFQFLT